MASSIDRALELLRRQKLRNRSLKLKLGQRAGFVFIDLGLRESRIANDVRKQIQRLVQILNQATGGNSAGQRRKAGVRTQSCADRINLLGDVLAGTLRRALAQQRRRETCQPAKIRLVCQTTTQHHKLHIEGGHLVRRKQDHLQTVLQGRFLSARKFHFQYIFINRRFAFYHCALGSLSSLTSRSSSLPEGQRRHEHYQDQCDYNIASVLHDSHLLNSFTVLMRRWQVWPSPSAW